MHTSGTNLQVLHLQKANERSNKFNHQLWTRDLADLKRCSKDGVADV
jgi:hypothetical protein